MTPRRIAQLLFAVVVLCSQHSLAAADKDLPFPVIPRGQGADCVEETQFMRRNHMTLLTHQRDQTVQKGIRSKQHSLNECISCHAVIGPDAIPVSVASPKHFCRACHDYAAVSIDCFECHSSRPESELLPADHGQGNALRATQSMTGITVRID